MVHGYPRNFTILDADDQRSILRDAYKQLQVDVKTYSYHRVLSYISNNKTNFIDANSALARANYEGERIMANVYAFYEKRLAEMFGLDFDDLLIFTYHILRSMWRYAKNGSGVLPICMLMSSKMWICCNMILLKCYLIEIVIYAL